MIQRRTALLLAAAGLAPASRARAQDWAPRRPIRMVVPFVPGGNTDIAARIMAQRMSTTLGVTVLVDNRGGGGGNIGGLAVAQAEPDGHTILMGTTGLLTTNALIYRNLGFDPAADFASVSLAFTADMMIAVHPSVPARSLREFVELARASPRAFTFGSSGYGASTHTAAELFCRTTGIEMTHVPYRGAGAAINDLIAGVIQVMVTQVSVAVAHVREGQVRGLAVMAPTRHALMPEVATTGENGWPEAEATSWGSIMAPARTPAPVIARLAAVMRETLADPKVIADLAAAGVDGKSSTPAELDRFLATEREKWGRIVREANIRVD